MSNNRSNSGNVVVELALTIPLFMFLLLGIIDAARLFSTYHALENAVRKAGRFGATGQVTTSSNGAILSRAYSIREIFLNAAAGVSPDDGTLCIQPLGGDCDGSFDAGESGGFFKISVSKTINFTPAFRVFFPQGKYQIQVGAAFRNESF